MHKFGKHLRKIIVTYMQTCVNLKNQPIMTPTVSLGSLNTLKSIIFPCHFQMKSVVFNLLLVEIKVSAGCHLKTFFCLSTLCMVCIITILIFVVIVMDLNWSGHGSQK